MSLSMHKLTGSLYWKKSSLLSKKTYHDNQETVSGRNRDMRTQAEQAQRGTITPQMEDIARSEGISPHDLRERIAAGSAVIMQRGKRNTGIGKGLSTKVNVNLGTSSTKVCMNEEIQKARNR